MRCNKDTEGCVFLGARIGARAVLETGDVASLVLGTHLFEIFEINRAGHFEINRAGHDNKGGLPFSP